MVILVRVFNSSPICVECGGHSTSVSGSQIKSHISDVTGIPRKLVHLSNRSICLGEDALVPDGALVEAYLHLEGGKGGFGSMLRAIGAQIEKTTNKEACRDLSGRRLRDINEEKRLKKWIAKQAEREREASERKRQRLARLLATPKHNFHDPQYDRQRSELTENIADAVAQGLQKEKTELEIPKRKASAAAGAPSKKPCLWLGADELQGEEVDSDDNEGSDFASDSGDSTKLCSPPTTSDESQSSEAAGPSTRIATDAQPVVALESDAPCSSRNENMLSTCTDFVAHPSSTTELSAEQQPEIHDGDGCQQKKMLLQLLPPPVNLQHQHDSKLPPELLDLSKYSSANELEQLGLDRLKMELSVLQMKCSGTLQQRAERLFSVRGIAKDDIPPALLAKSQKSAVKRA